MFDFTLAFGLSGEILTYYFDELFLEWYDAGKPDSNIRELTGQGMSEFILYEFPYIDSIEEESRRWSRWVERIFYIGDRYFSIGFDQGLTEMQENEYWDSDIKEVIPVDKVVTIREWHNV